MNRSFNRSWWAKSGTALALSPLLLGGMRLQSPAAQPPTTTLASFPSVSAPDSVLPADAERQAMDNVRADSIRDVTTALTAREMEGRGAAQRGGERAARWIATCMAQIGLKPLGDGSSFLQRVPLRGYQVRPDSTLTISGKSFVYERDFKAEGYATNQSRLRETMTAQGELVFAGYGVSAPTLGRDDLKGADLRGKIAVIFYGSPEKARGAAWDAVTWKTVRQMLARRGATGIITMTLNPDFLPADKPDIRRRVGLTGGTTKNDPALPPCILVSRSVGEELFSGSGITFEEALTQAQSDTFTARNLHKTAKLSLRVAFETGQDFALAYNVVGMLEGSDPKLRNEAIVYSAHYDAFGKEKDGRVFPGAADNALGVGNMLAVADAMTKLRVRPRRSVLFLSTTGEETGLLGAAYWTTHPTWPPARVVADLNFDGYGTEIWGPVTTFFGFGMTHSDLASIVTGATKAMSKGLLPDPAPQEQALQRGDQWEFIRHGIPSIQVAGAGGNIFGLLARVTKFEREDYHQPGDTIRPDWDWNGARTLAQFYLLAGLRIANANTRPAISLSSPFARSRGETP